MDKIVVRGAREHNLKNVSVEIPRNTLTVITGVSGSGKSSLAFDTLYAEGQRRYVESLSSYARQFLERLEKPDVDSIEGLSPAIAIQQRSASRNPRSTVGTVTEIYDYLRVLFARLGTPYCYKCNGRIESQTIQQMVDRVLALPEGTRVTVLAPMALGKKGEFRKELSDLRKAGFVRVLADRVIRDLEEEIPLERNVKHDIDIVVDRLVVRGQSQRRLADSLEVAARFGKENVKVQIDDPRGEVGTPSVALFFSQRFACHVCGISYPELSPRAFSFNNPQGACPACGGIGNQFEPDPDLIVPDPSLSLAEEAIVPWSGRQFEFFRPCLEAVAARYGVDFDCPYQALPEKVKSVLLYGSGKEEIQFSDSAGRGRPFEGIIPWLSRRAHAVSEEEDYEERFKYARERPCSECKGARLRRESLFVRVGGKSISEATSLPLKELGRFFDSLTWNERDMAVGGLVLKEIRARLKFLLDVGLDYLTLDRPTWTLSGGESQRIRLATQVGSGLVGVLYILDEPTIGLHQRDNARLLRTLKGLRDIGNTVVVVEHDRDTILESDYVIDMGPNAGVLGGSVVAKGRPDEIQRASSISLTGQYLSGSLKVWNGRARRRGNGNLLIVRGARHNNLKGITVRFPLHVMSCVTGVSGSGKSSLAIDTVYRGLARLLGQSRESPGEVEEILGWEMIDRVIEVDQSPIGRTPRSNPATYIGMFTLVRDLFAKLPDARARGYGPARFSFNVKGGRCEACLGAGVVRIGMHFLPDAFVTCELCKGRRYDRETLDVHYKGKSIADILDLTIEEALPFFSSILSFRQKMEVLRDVGLGYLKLGQPATTLSGGEAQRIKLGKELVKRTAGRTLYILDEPTTGLHFDDVRRLIDVLNRLVDQGNTVIIIEHNLDVIMAADFVVDLGPEGGDNGGMVVAAGTPEEISSVGESHTGQCLGSIISSRGRGMDAVRGVAAALDVG